jgi:hypothetical protein
LISVLLGEVRYPLFQRLATLTRKQSLENPYFLINVPILFPQHQANLNGL